MGGRWNSPGRPLVYASVHLSLAVLETLVHLNPERFPQNSVAYSVELPGRSVERVSLQNLASDWTTDPSFASTRAIGDAWLEGERSLVLLVPSAVVPQEENVLINPEHALFVGSVRIASGEPFLFDPRLGR